MLTGIREVHNVGFLHRDIKPANFCIGKKDDGKQRTIYILDFGIARLWRNQFVSEKRCVSIANQILQLFGF